MKEKITFLGIGNNRIGSPSRGPKPKCRPVRSSVFYDTAFLPFLEALETTGCVFYHETLVLNMNKEKKRNMFTIHYNPNFVWRFYLKNNLNHDEIP